MEKTFLKQMINFSKTAFDNTFTAMVSFQDQIEAVSTKTIEQAAWLPEEGIKAINDWVGACKKGREDFKKAVDENYGKVEEFFSSN